MPSNNEERTTPLKDPESATNQRRVGSDPGKPKGGKDSATNTGKVRVGEGGELHQIASAGEPVLTTNQAIPVADDQNSLRANPKGPTLLEDFVLREKITHF